MAANSKKIHPADQADRDAIAQAVSFNVHLRRSPTSKVNESAATLADAVRAYDALVSADENRRPIIYAIMKSGATVPVPKDMISAGRAPMFDQSAPPPVDIVQTVQGGTIMNALGADLPAPAFEIPDHLLRGYDSPEAAAAPVVVIVQARRAGKSEAIRKAGGKRAEVAAAAEAGVIPPAPDFSADTHKRFRKRLAELVAMAEAGDLAGLKADTTEPKSSSRVALCRWRDLAIKAIEAQPKKAAA